MPQWNEGQRLKGSDGNIYVVQGGVPVLAQPAAPSPIGGIVTKGPDPTLPYKGRQAAAETTVAEGNAAGTPARLQAGNLANQKTQLEIQKLQKELADQAGQQKQSDAMEATRGLLSSIARARGLTSGWSTGVGGWLGQMAPWSDQANQLETVINQEVRGNIFNNWVAKMKAVSDNGSTGIGRILQSEIPLVTGAQGALDPVKMGQEGTLRSLSQIEQHALRSAALLNNMNPDDPKIISMMRAKLEGNKPRSVDDILKQHGVVP